MRRSQSATVSRPDALPGLPPPARADRRRAAARAAPRGTGPTISTSSCPAASGFRSTARWRSAALRASELRLEDPSVSRNHARIDLDEHGAGAARTPARATARSSTAAGCRTASPCTPGCGSSSATAALDVAERIDEAAAGHTVSVPAGHQPDRRAAGGAPRAHAVASGARKPRLRSGWSLKRLPRPTEGAQRYVLKDHRSGRVRRAWPSAEAELVQLLDGRHDLVELIGEASARCGADGPARLARLLAELADRGLLAGRRRGRPRRPRAGLAGAAAQAARAPAATASRADRRRSTAAAAFCCSPRSALARARGLAVAGLVAFGCVIAARYGTPFVVAQRVGPGRAGVRARARSCWSSATSWPTAWSPSPSAGR